MTRRKCPTVDSVTLLYYARASKVDRRGRLWRPTSCGGQEIWEQDGWKRYAVGARRLQVTFWKRGIVLEEFETHGVEQATGGVWGGSRRVALVKRQHFGAHLARTQRVAE
jgi:hypothetical protein